MDIVPMQDVDPRVLIAHYEEVISRKRDSLGSEFSGLPAVMLLCTADRKQYLLCLAAMKRFNAAKGTMGIKTPADMVEHIQLVERLLLSQSEVPAGELRKFSLSLLRAISYGEAVSA